MYEHNALGYWSGLALCLTKIRSSRARCPATALIFLTFDPKHRLWVLVRTTSPSCRAAKPLSCRALKPLSHYCVSTHVSTAYQDTKIDTSRVRRTYVSIRSSYSSIRSSYSSYAEVLRLFMFALKN